MKRVMVSPSESSGAVGRGLEHGYHVDVGGHQMQGFRKEWTARLMPTKGSAASVTCERVFHRMCVLAFGEVSLAVAAFVTLGQGTERRGPRHARRCRRRARASAVQGAALWWRQWAGELVQWSWLGVVSRLFEQCRQPEAESSAPVAANGPWQVELG